MKQVINFKVVQVGATYTLISNMNKILFMPNSWGLTQKEEDAINPYERCYSPYKNSVGLFKSYENVPVNGYSFLLGEEKIAFKGNLYPVATSYKEETNEPIEPVLKVSINQFWERSPNMGLPRYEDFIELEKDSNGEIQVSGSFVYAFSEQAQKELQEAYDSQLDLINADLDCWEESQDWKVGDTVYGVSIISVEKCRNGSAKYHFVGGGSIHEIDMEEYTEGKELPEGVQEVTISWGRFSFLSEGKWFERLEDVQPEVNF